MGRPRFILSGEEFFRRRTPKCYWSETWSTLDDACVVAFSLYGGRCCVTLTTETCNGNNEIRHIKERKASLELLPKDIEISTTSQAHYLHRWKLNMTTRDLTQ